MASDHESQWSHEEKKKRRMKIAAYIAAFAVFQVIVILVFVMVVMKVRTPKFRIGNGVTVTASSGDSLSFTAPIRVKNNNFGPYKFDATTINFTAGDPGVQVGQATVPKSKAGFMSTKKIDLPVTLNSLNSTALTGSSGTLTLNGQGKMNGKAEIMFIFKKKKSTNMNCTLEFDVSAKTVNSVVCK